MDRLLRLSLIIKNLGSIKGDKNLQKMIYLLQSHGDDIGYHFKWNVFGPVSFQLENDSLITISGRVMLYGKTIDNVKVSIFRNNEVIAITEFLGLRTGCGIQSQSISP